MLRILRTFRGRGVGQSSGYWLTLLLLLVLLVPTLAALWFMARAVENERLAARQRWVDAYRVHLASAQQRLDVEWRRRHAEATQLPAQNPRAVFAALVTKGSADGAVILGIGGQVLYPDAIPIRGAAETGEWKELQDLESREPAAAATRYAQLADTSDAVLRARATLAHGRALVRVGKPAAAMEVLEKLVEDPANENVLDSAGRHAASHAALMMLDLAQSADVPRDASKTLQRLAHFATSYTGPAIAASQRRFLLRELTARTKHPLAQQLLKAEEISARLADSLAALERTEAVRPIPGAELWAYAPVGVNWFAVHRSDALAERLCTWAAVREGLTNLRVEAVAAGKDADAALVSMPAGPLFPGWRFALYPAAGDTVDEMAASQVSTFVWIGVLSVGAVVLLGALSVILLRQQFALSQLRNDLVANVTHELKTPLASMRLLVDTLLESPTHDPKRNREYLQMIASENLRLSRLIDNFLTFSRIERNKYVFRHSELSVADVLRGAAAVVQEKFRSADCQFTLRIADDAGRVRGDADALVTAIVNLLENAFKYSGENKQIELFAENDGANVKISVRDNGIGLSPMDQRRVFKRFYQVHSHLAAQGGGFGLGLSIVQFIARAHDGRVEVISELGKGSTFSLYLPRIP
jgi:signal transduction histidine kinase